MRLYNPTPEIIYGKCQGRNYFIEPGFHVKVSDSTGQWIMDRFKHYGLVDLSTDVPKEKKLFKNFVIEQSLKGLEVYIEHLNSTLESYIALDTELKNVNAHGTVLKGKHVREISANIEVATSMIKEIEKKFGKKLKRDHIEDKTKTLFTAIDVIVGEFEQDKDAQEQAAKEDKEIEETFEQLIPKEVKEMRDRANSPKNVVL